MRSSRGFERTIGERQRQLDLNAAPARIAQDIEHVETEWLDVSEQLERADA